MSIGHRTSGPQLLGTLVIVGSADCSRARIWRNRRAAACVAKIIFFVFIVLFLISLLFGGVRGGFRRGP
jgi:hypothetical protein